MVIPAPTVEAAFATDTDRAFQKLAKDKRYSFWVSWSQADETIVAACEAIAQTGRLRAMREPTELILLYGEKELRLVLTGEPVDRHATLLALNEILAGDWEIRFIWESIGADVGAFLALPCPTWRQLEQRDPNVVARRVLVLAPNLNVFTQVTPNMKPPSPPAIVDPAKPWWKLWA
jgi:hypothetical protein